MLKNGTLQLKISAIFILLLGIIHTFFAAFALEPLLVGINKDLKMTMYFMFIASGLAIIFSGTLSLYIAGLSKTTLNLIALILHLNTLFLILLGILAILFMFTNPFSYLTLLAAVFHAVSVFNLKKETRNV